MYQIVLILYWYVSHIKNISKSIVLAKKHMNLQKYFPSGTFLIKICYALVILFLKYHEMILKNSINSKLNLI